MNDLISRKAAIDALDTTISITGEKNALVVSDYIKTVKERLEELPSAESDIKPIDYRECANAMLRMWIDNVVTDGEYNRIMDKLNAYWGMQNG